MSTETRVLVKLFAVFTADVVNEFEKGIKGKLVAGGNKFWEK